MPKKATSTTQKLVACKAAYKALQETMQEQMRLKNEEIASLRANPPVLATDRDEQGNVVPEPAPPVALPPTRPQSGKYKLPPGRAFRVVRTGQQIALTAKALGGGSATMLFPIQLAVRIGRTMCKVALQLPEQPTVAEEVAQAQ